MIDPNDPNAQQMMQMDPNMQPDMQQMTEEQI
jgi:hypothetical protein